jgi:hypothetical protein
MRARMLVSVVVGGCTTNEPSKLHGKGVSFGLGLA